MNSNFTHPNSKLRIDKLLRSSSAIFRNCALALSLFTSLTFINTNSLLAQCGVVVTQPSVTFNISLDGGGMAVVNGATPQVAANLSATMDPPCDTYVFYLSNGVTLIGDEINGTYLNCMNEGVELTFVVRIAEDNTGTNASVDFLTIHVTPQDNELPTWVPVPGALDAALECDMVDAYVVSILAIPLLTAVDNCDPNPIVSVATDMTFPGMCPNSYVRVITYTAVDDAGNVSLPYTVTITSTDTTPPGWSTAIGALNATVDCDDAAGLAAAQALVPVPMDNCSDVADITVQPLFIKKYTGGGNPQPIPAAGTGDGACPAPTLTVSTAPVAAAGIIGTTAILHQVRINLTHMFDGDLDITLISPMGTPWDLSSDNGGSGDDYTNTIFQDGAPSITLGSPPFTSIFQAEGGPFSAAFAGESITGVWTLSICDDAAIDVGTLLDFQLTFLVTAFPPGGDDDFVPGCGMTGVYTEHWQAVDECGNISGIYTQTITVVDNDAPTSTQADITVSALDPPACNAFVALTLNAGNTSDNCDPFGALTILNDGGGIGVGNGLADASGVYPLGTTTVTFSLTDVCGNNSLHLVDVIVEDNNPPVISYANIVQVMNTTMGDCSNIFGWTRPFAGAPDAIDCSPPITVTETVMAPTPAGTAAIVSAIGPYVPGTAVVALFPVGTTIITYTFTDSEGNAAIRTVSVTVEDNENPVAVCQNIVVQLDANGNASITPGMIDNGSDDNCGIATMSVAPNTFDCMDVGNNMVTLTVTDLSGNMHSCNATVTVQDIVDPVAQCQNITVQLNAMGTASITAAQINNGSSDACGIASTTINVSNFNCSNVGANNVNLTVTDNNGNVSVCPAVVTVEDNVAPTAICQNIIVQLDAFGNASITAAQVNNGSNDACGIQSLSVAPNTFGCGNIGPNIVVLTVTDVNGNISTCNATVTVQDMVPPVALCQDITVQLDGNNMASIVGADVNNGSTDACGIASLSVTPNSFNCSDVGNNLVTLTVTDNNGNMSSCVATVTVEDIVPPSIVCASGATVVNDIISGTFNGQSAIPDNCSPGALEQSIVVNVPMGSTILDVNVSLEIEHSWVGDLSGQIESPSGTIISFFHRPGTSSGSCINDFGFGCSGNNLSVTFDDETANTYIAFENTCSSIPAISGTFMPQNLFSIFDGENPQGNWIISIQDNAGADTGDLLFASIDIVYEYFVVGNTIERNTDPGSCDYTAVGTEFDPTSWNDNCPPATVSHDYPVAPFLNTLDGAVFPVGQTNVTWTVTDGSGNTSTCNIAIDVTDNQLPTQTGGQGNGTTISVNAVGCTAVVNWVPPTFTDNCPPVTVVSNFAPGFSFPVGVTTVEYTATDLYNNSTIVSFDVEVNDNTPPVAGCQPIPLNFFLGLNGLVTVDAYDVNLGSMDNCGNIILSISVDGGPFVPDYTFNCLELGSHNVTLLVSDGILTDDCQAIVNVFDNIAPMAECKDITVNLNASGLASITANQVDDGSTDNALLCLSLSIDVSSFNCSDIGDNPVTLTATDAAGNQDQCVATVTVEDNLPPNLFGVPNDITISCSVNPPNPPVIGPGGITANDNCNVPVIIFNQTSTKSGNPNNCLNYSYVITRTWTASDNSSNTTMDSQLITVVDNSAPTSPTYSATVGNNNSISTNPNDCFATITLNMTNLSDCAPFANLVVTNNALALYGKGNGLTSASGNYGIGSYTITFTATDPCGNTSNFNYSFSVYDGVAPVAACVNNLNLGLPSSGTLVLSPGAINNGSYDNCNGSGGIASMTVSPNVFDCSDVGGPHTVTLTVTDFAGNSSSCVTSVNIQDNNDPIALCQPASLILGPNGTVSLNASQVNAGSFDDCTSVTLSVSPNSFNQNNLGNNIVTLTVTDGHGNSSTCLALVTVSLPPTCFNIGTVSGGAGNVVSVPVTVEDFTGVVGFQFQLQIMSDADSIHWDSIGEFVGVSGIHPSLNNLLEHNLLGDSLFTPIDTTYSDILDGMGNPFDGILDSIDVITYDTTLFYNNMSVSWLQFNPAGPISLPHGTIIFYIDILLTGNLNNFSVVKIVNPSIQTPPEITYSFNSLLYNLVPCWDNGQIFIGQLIVSGNIHTEIGANVAQVFVDRIVPPGSNTIVQTVQTGLDGNYMFILNSSTSFDIRPRKAINWFNGIDILDVAAIQQHAVNFMFVNSAYKKIAADVNGTNTITTFDAVQLNQYLSSGFTLAPPPQPSWKFADAKQMLPNLPNATVPPYNSRITLTNIISDSLNNDFIGIKTGDIAGNTANPANITGGGAEDLSDADLKFMIENKAVKENEIFKIDLRAENFDQLIGYQWILQFDPEALRFTGYENGSLVNLGDGNFGEVMVDEGKLILTWYHAYPTDINEEDVLFTLNFEALRSAKQLSDLIRLGELIQLAPVAYNGDYDARDIDLVFVEAKDVDGAFALYQNIPNPFKDETVISFNLPEPTNATLKITDISGRLLKIVEGDFDKGYNEVNISRSDLPQSGILFYELVTPNDTATKQMIVIE